VSKIILLLFRNGGMITPSENRWFNIPLIDGISEAVSKKEINPLVLHKTGGSWMEWRGFRVLYTYKNFAEYLKNYNGSAAAIKLSFIVGNSG
jgi:hypothetical protein